MRKRREMDEVVRWALIGGGALVVATVAGLLVLGQASQWLQTSLLAVPIVESGACYTATACRQESGQQRAQTCAEGGANLGYAASTAFGGALFVDREQCLAPGTYDFFHRSAVALYNNAAEDPQRVSQATSECVSDLNLILNQGPPQPGSGGLPLVAQEYPCGTAWANNRWPRVQAVYVPARSTGAIFGDGSGDFSRSVNVSCAALLRCGEASPAPFSSPIDDAFIPISGSSPAPLPTGN